MVPKTAIPILSLLAAFLLVGENYSGPLYEIVDPAKEIIGAKVNGPTSPDGKVTLHCDLPGRLHLKNKGGSDGAGLCVFTSINHAAYWQNVAALSDFRDWMTRYPGGSWPEKTAKKVAEICKEKGLPEPAFFQVEDKSALDVLKVACKSGRMPGVTYSYSPTGRYNGQKIAHMVSLVHADDDWFCILDNNYPGYEAFEWMTPQEFSRVWTGWAFILLDPGPPPIPKN